MSGLAASAFGDEVDTGEDEEYCREFDDGESIHSECYGDKTCYDRLNVVIHAHDCRAEGFLADNYQRV